MSSQSVARDVRDAIVNLVRGHGLKWEHTHRADDGGLIETDNPVRIWNALQPPIITDSSMLVEHLNADYWRGHRYTVSTTAPTAKALGDFWVDSSGGFQNFIFNVWDGREWQNIATISSVAWTNITGKPSTFASDWTTMVNTPATFPATPHNVLSATHGDTVTASAVAGDMIYASGANAWQRIGIGGTDEVLTVLSGRPAWQPVAAGGHAAHALLDGNHMNDTTAGAPVVGDLITASGASWERYAKGATGQVLTVLGATVGWAPAAGGAAHAAHALLDGSHMNDSVAHAPTKGDLILADGSNLWDGLGIGAVGQVLTVSAGGLPSWAAAAGGGATSWVRHFLLMGG